jgi:hypothetical protein
MAVQNIKASFGFQVLTALVPRAMRATGPVLEKGACASPQFRRTLRITGVAKASALHNAFQTCFGRILSC